MKTITEFINEAKYPGYMSESQYTSSSINIDDEIKIEREWYSKIHKDKWKEIFKEDYSNAEISKIDDWAIKNDEVVIYYNEDEDYYACLSLYEYNEDETEFIWDILGCELTIDELYEVLLNK